MFREQSYTWTGNFTGVGAPKPTMFKGQLYKTSAKNIKKPQDNIIPILTKRKSQTIYKA